MRKMPCGTRLRRAKPNADAEEQNVSTFAHAPDGQLPQIASIQIAAMFGYAHHKSRSAQK
jgi:hypothetical protein